MANQDDDQKKKQQQAAQPIGKPIIPQQDQGEASQPPDVQAPPPVQVQGSIGTPLYPTPAQEKASQVEQAPYHPGTGMRVLDAVGRVIPAVGDVEAGAGIGMPGYSQRMSQAEAASKSEQEREKVAEGQQDSQANVEQRQATAGEQNALAAQHEAQSKMVTLHDPNGNTITMPQADYDKYQVQGSKNAGATDTAHIRADATQGAAQTNADAKVISAAIAAGKSGKPVQGTVDGKLAWGLYVPGSGWFDPQTNQSMPKFTPPPSWAEGLTPVQTTNEQGLPEVGAFHRDTGKIDPTGATSGSGTGAAKIQNAHTALRMLDNMAPLIDKMTKNGELGIFKGRLSQWLDTNIGDAPPDVSDFQQRMRGLVSTMQNMYGFRRADVIEDLSSQMGARMTPESLAGALNGVKQHATSIIGPNSGGGTGQSNTPQTFTDGGRTYHIPPNMVDEFKKDHPKATLQPASDAGESGSHIGAIEPRPLSPGEHLDNPPFKSTYSADEAQRYRDYLASLKRI